MCLTFLCCRQLWNSLVWKVLSTFYLKPAGNEHRNPKSEAIRVLEAKRAQLQRELRKPRHRPVMCLHVRRSNIFQDSFDYIMPWFGKTSLKHSEIRVKFLGEDGVDVGGLTREWFIELSKQVYSDELLTVFSVSDSDNGVLVMNPFHQMDNAAKSMMDFINRALSTDFFSPKVLKQCRFFGIIIGKAIYESQLMNCHFTRSLYKHILNKAVDFDDLQHEDPQFFMNLMGMMDYNVDDAMLELTFSVNEPIGDTGKYKTIDLKSNGRQIRVTDKNKFEYINLMTRYKLVERTKLCTLAFCEGLFEVIPQHLLASFSVEELDMLIAGLPYIDVDDWRKNTLYASYKPVQILWFWQIVEGFDQEDLEKLLQFTTGSSKVPPSGFAHLRGPSGVNKFTIRFIENYPKGNGADGFRQPRLPVSHTCFNLLDLPEYQTKEEMEKMLRIGITEGGSFGTQ